MQPNRITSVLKFLFILIYSGIGPVKHRVAHSIGLLDVTKSPIERRETGATRYARKAVKSSARNNVLMENAWIFLLQT